MSRHRTPPDDQAGPPDPAPSRRTSPSHIAIPGITLGSDDFRRARRNVAPHIHHTPLLTSRSLSEASGFDVRLKAD